MSTLTHVEKATFVEASRHFSSQCSRLDWISVPAGGAQLNSIDMGEQLRAPLGARSSSTLEHNNMADDVDGMFTEEAGGLHLNI